MKLLIAIVTCAAYRARADLQRATWAKESTGLENRPSAGVDTWKGLIDVKFFIGGENAVERDDEILLPVPDDYKSLPLKTKAAFAWAIAEGYDFIFKCDDDVYLRPERLLLSGFDRHDYSGRLRGPSGGHPAPYASGFSYWVSKRAAQIVVDAEWNGDSAEDRFVGNILLQAGIQCHPDYRYKVVTSYRNAKSGSEGPRRGNACIAACEYDTAQLMYGAHEAWESFPSEALAKQEFGKLDRIGIMVKTFLRDGYLAKTVEGIQNNIPEAKLVIVDDGYESRNKLTAYARLRDQGHACVWLPFDSGFGAKANAAIAHCDREYTLIASDDFDFNDPTVRGGVEKLLKVMDALPEVGIASGRVDNRAYEGYIERGPAYIKEIRIDDSKFDNIAGVDYKLCDLTVNYSLVRSKILGFESGQVHWHDQWKIGGDHFTFFDEIKKAGWKIAYVPGVNINQMPYMPQLMHPDYPRYRARARKALPSFFAMQKITEYIGFDGRVDRLCT